MAAGGRVMLGLNAGKLIIGLGVLRLQPFDTSTEEGRAKERHRRAALGSGANLLAKMISVGTALVSIPLTLNYLGVEQYGMWATLSSFVALLNFADLGVGNGLVNAVSRSMGEGNNRDIRRHISSAYAVLMTISLVIMAIVAIIAPYVAWAAIFNVSSPEAKVLAEPVCIVFLLCFALGLPMSVVQKVQIGLQSGFEAALWQCAASVLTLVTVFIAIFLKCDLTTLVVSFVATPISVYLINTVYFFYRHRELRPLPVHVSKVSATRLLHTGLLFLVLQIAFAVTFSSDSVVIAQTLGAAEVAKFSVADKLFGLVATLSAAFLGPLWPAYSEAIGRGDKAWILTTIRRSVISSTLLAAAASAAIAVSAPIVVKHFVSEEVIPTALLLAAMAIWRTLSATGGAVSMYLNGAGVIWFQVIVAIITSLATIFLKFVLVNAMGISGVTWATVLCYLFLTLVPYGIYMAYFDRRMGGRP